MTKRLVWNFEIDCHEPLLVDGLPSSEREETRWEVRYFWSETDIVQLTHCPKIWLDLANFEIKHRQDNYYLLPDYPYNIKLRANELLYKPLVAQDNKAKGFIKKINLNDLYVNKLLPGLPPINSEELLQAIHEKAQEITIHKTALVYKFPTTPKMKLELSRLNIHEQTYFSLCIEGRSLQLVKFLSQRLLETQVSCDYVTFLKKIKPC